MWQGGSERGVTLAHRGMVHVVPPHSAGHKHLRLSRPRMTFTVHVPPFSQPHTLAGGGVVAFMGNIILSDHVNINKLLSIISIYKFYGNLELHG